MKKRTWCNNNHINNNNCACPMNDAEQTTSQKRNISTNERWCSDLSQSASITEYQKSDQNSVFTPSPLQICSSSSTLVPKRVPLGMWIFNPFPALAKESLLLMQFLLKRVTVACTLRASLSATLLQTVPDLVTPLKGHSLSPRSCPATRSAPSERFGY